MGKLSLFAIGQRGNDVVNKPQDLDESELIASQNAEVANSAMGGLDQRPGMTKVSGAALGASVTMALDLASEFLTEKTPYLYAGLYTGATGGTWRRSSDGTTWANVSTPAAPWSSNASILYYAKNFPKCASIGKYLYFVDKSAPISVHRWDGTTDLTISKVPPAVSGTTLTTPTLTAVTPAGEPLTTPTLFGYNGGGGGASTYKAVAIYPSGNHSAPSALYSTNIGGQFGADGVNGAAFTDGAVRWDIYRISGGSTTGLIGSITGTGASLSITDTNLPGDSSSPPGSASLAFATTYTYKVVAIAGGSHSIASAGVTTAVSVATLTSYNWNTLSISGSPVAGATSYDVYRTAGGATQGKIGSIGISGGAFTTGNGSGLGSGLVFTDGGLAGDSAVAPVAASGVTAGDALAVLDLYADGDNLYLAVLDLTSGKSSGGRILKFNPLSQTWTQILKEFPVVANQGAPGTIGPWDGALNYGSYIGVETGTGTTTITSALTPLPAGGVQEVHATASGVVATAFQGFAGALFVSTGITTSGAVATVQKRSYPTGAWTGAYASASTGVGTGAGNAFTTLGTFNGLLFTGWTGGAASTGAALPFIASTPDGVTWTTELTLATEEVPCQMVTFKNAFYVVLGKTSAAYNTKSRILQRTTGGVWTEVDNPTDDFAGCLGVVWV